jgi:hypothetical protein
MLERDQLKPIRNLSKKVDFTPKHYMDIASTLLNPKVGLMVIRGDFLSFAKRQMVENDSF